jgi:hypothetical protein
MRTNHQISSLPARVLKTGGVAVLFLMLSPAWAQAPAEPGSEQTAPAIPLDLVNPAAETSALAPGKEAGTAADGAPAKDATPVTDYSAQIGNGMKERERRLVLLNEAMMKLREAGEMEDAGRVEERIRALLEMPAPSQASTKLRSEIEQLRAKNDDLTLQLLALQEELKRYRPANGSNGSTRKGVASTER